MKKYRSDSARVKEVVAPSDNEVGDLEGLFPNNFNLIRHILALIVVVVHARVLSREEVLTPLAGHLNSHYAVMGFFAISGFLITRSCLRSSSWWRYMGNRLRRLMPAYLAFLVVAVTLGSIFSVVGFAEYWSSYGTYRYIVANLTFLQFLEPNLPGLFSSNPSASAVNGALWSIRTEMFCYLLVPFFCWFASRSGRRVASVTAMAASLLGVLLIGLAPLNISKVIAHQLLIGVAMPIVCFVCGAALFYFWDFWRKQRIAVLSVTAILWVLHYTVPLGWAENIVAPFMVSGLALSCGVFFPYIGNWTPAGDLSYGIYIYHFPIVQTLVATGLYHSRPFASLGLTFAITITVAMVSWHFIESPALSRSSYYLRL